MVMQEFVFSVDDDGTITQSTFDELKALFASAEYPSAIKFGYAYGIDPSREHDWYRFSFVKVD